MLNKEVVNEVRAILFHLVKSYMKIEDEKNIMNPYEADYSIFDYLDEVIDILEDYKKTLKDYKQIVIDCLSVDRFEDYIKDKEE